MSEWVLYCYELWYTFDMYKEQVNLQLYLLII